jgi:hypothetical protein
MGYFPNGATADRYREQWCENCVHWPGDDSPDECPVWLLHFEYSRIGFQGLSLLARFIPYHDTQNGQCTMFVQRGPARPETMARVNAGRDTDSAGAAD